MAHRPQAGNSAAALARGACLAEWRRIVQLQGGRLSRRLETTSISHAESSHDGRDSISDRATGENLKDDCRVLIERRLSCGWTDPTSPVFLFPGFTSRALMCERSVSKTIIHRLRPATRSLQLPQCLMMTLAFCGDLARHASSCFSPRIAWSEETAALRAGDLVRGSRAYL